jgi:S1-C subfamily serine protease
LNGLNLRLKGLAGIRFGNGIRPGAGLGPLVRSRSNWAAIAAVFMIAGLVVVTVGFGHALQSEIVNQEHSIRDLQTQVEAFNARFRPQPDWPAIATSVEPSVLTVSTAEALGSGWVAHSDDSGSDVVTNLHVVADAWNAGVVTVDVGVGDRTFKGTITRVDVNDDLASIHVDTKLPALQQATVQAQLAESVMAIGSPLGLDGSVSIGVISGFRSIEGSDYIQFSAAISPGNSGGPVVDADGHVVAVSTAKFVAPGAEALSLAIPVQIVCRFVVCQTGKA